MSSTSTGSAHPPPPSAPPRASNTAAASQVPQSSNAAVAPPQQRSEPALGHGTWYRTPDPLVVRYRGLPNARFITDPEKQRFLSLNICDQLDHYIPKHPPKAVFHLDLGIVFDQEVIGPHVYQVIDIICPTMRVCRGVEKELKLIRHKNDDGKHAFELYACGPDLPMDVLPFNFDVCHVSTADQSPCHFSNFLPALSDLASKLGALTGPIRMVHAAMGRTDGASFGPMIRGYIKLARDTLDLDFEELLDRAEFSLKWDGESVLINYAFKHLRCYKAYELLHPDRLAEMEGRDTKRAAETDAPTSSSPTKRSKGKERQLD